MQKDKLKGKYIMYLDKDGAYRTEKVVKITGKTLTLQNVYKERHRIHPKNTKIFGVLKKLKIRFKTMADYLEEITW